MLRSALSTRRFYHWHIFIYKAIHGMLPPYLQIYIQQKTMESYCLCSHNYYY